MMVMSRKQLAFWLGHIVGFLPTAKHDDPIYKAIQLYVDYDSNEVNLRCTSPALMFDIPVMECDIEGDFQLTSFAIDAVSLHHIAAKSTGDDLIFEYEDGAAAVFVRTENMSANQELIPMEGSLALPSEEEVVHGEVGIVTMRNILSNAFHFLSKDSARPELMGVFLQGTSVYATDAEQGVVISFDGMTFPDEGLNFMPHAVLDLVGSASVKEGEEERKMTISSTNEWVIFSAGPFKLYIKRYVDLFATDVTDDIVSTGAVSNNGKVTMMAAGLKEALDRVSFYADSQKTIVLHLDRKRPYLSAFHMGSFRSKVYLSGTSVIGGDNLNILIPLSAFQSLLKCGLDKIVLRFNKDDAQEHDKGDLIQEPLYLEEGPMKYWLLPATV